MNFPSLYFWPFSCAYSWKRREIISIAAKIWCRKQLIRIKSYVFPTQNRTTTNTEYVNNSVHSGHHHSFFLVSFCDVHTYYSDRANVRHTIDEQKINVKLYIHDNRQMSMNIIGNTLIVQLLCKWAPCFSLENLIQHISISPQLIFWSTKASICLLDDRIRSNWGNAKYN